MVRKKQPHPSLRGIQYERTFDHAGLTSDERRWITDYRNPKCPLSHFIGNQKALRRLSRAAYSAWGQPNHDCSDQSFALVGPSSTGKTTLARLFGDSVLLPFVEIHPKSVKGPKNILEEIQLVLEKIKIYSKSLQQEITLQLVPNIDNHFIVPPLVLFIDEVHALSNPIVQSLLKAIEPKDGHLATEEGWTADCRKVCWIIATTDRGLLFDAFDTRFRKIHLNLYDREEIAQIVHLNNKDWSMDVCRIVAKYCWRVPREAIAFAQDMRTEYEMQSKRGHVSWEEVAAAVAQDSDIDPMGMTLQRIKVLVALGQQGAIPRGRLCHYAQCKEEELVKFVMPALITATDHEPALVAVTSKGYSITRSGLEELTRRGIPHNGDEAVVMDIPPLDWGGYDPESLGYDLGRTKPKSGKGKSPLWLPSFMSKLSFTIRSL